MWKDEAAIDNRRSVLRVDRAIADLRRGQVVRIEHHEQTCLAVAAETAPRTVIEELTSLSGHRPSLIITLQRAAVLGLAADEELPLAVALPADAGLRWIQQLAFTMIDAATDEAAALVKQIQTREADYASAIAVQLAKFARLLPAVLVVPQDVSSQVLSSVSMPGGILGVSTDDIEAYPRNLARTLKRVSDAKVPLADAGTSQFVLFRGADGMTEHLAIIVGRPALERSVMVRVHSACLTGDIFGSLKCDCGEQLRNTIRMMAEAGGGVLLYLAQEGRGIGLANKLRAYELQAAGHDTLDADTILGFEHDERHFEVAAEMLRQLGVKKVKLMTNNPQKLSALEAEGIRVDARIPVTGSINPHNQGYLHTKIKRAGHLFETALNPDAA